METVSSTLGGSTRTCWNRRSRALSFSMYLQSAAQRVRDFVSVTGHNAQQEWQPDCCKWAIEEMKIASRMPFDVEYSCPCRVCKTACTSQPCEIM